MSADTIEINRAPVLTLWIAVVAERMGHTWDTALTIGKVFAGLKNPPPEAVDLGSL